jgi:hypothetical protein
MQHIHASGPYEQLPVVWIRVSPTYPLIFLVPAYPNYHMTLTHTFICRILLNTYLADEFTHEGHAFIMPIQMLAPDDEEVNPPDDGEKDLFDALGTNLRYEAIDWYVPSNLDIALRPPRVLANAFMQPCAIDPIVLANAFMQPLCHFCCKKVA